MLRQNHKSPALAEMARNNHQKAMERYNADPAFCLNCHSKIIPLKTEVPSMAKTKKFCSHSCAGTYNNARFPKRKRTNQCRACSKPIWANRTYCSPTCRETLKLSKRIDENLLDIRRKDNRFRVISFRQRLKLRCVIYKGGKCVICGYNKSIRSLCFHHVDPSQKDFHIASGIPKKWEAIQPELDKCILVCANCHGEVHDGLHPQYVAPQAGFEPAQSD